MAEHEADGVEIPGVTVEASIERAGDPLVLIVTKGDGAGQVTIHVSANGMDEDALCALLRVVATTIEERASSSVPSGGGDGPCQDCMRVYPSWFAPHEVWNRVMGGPEATDDPGGLLCPTCWLVRADAVTPLPAWLVTPPGQAGGR